MPGQVGPGLGALAGVVQVRSRLILIHPCRGDPSSPKSHLQSPACRARQRSRFLFGSSGWPFLSTGCRISCSSSCFIFFSLSPLIDELVGNWGFCHCPSLKGSQGKEKRKKKKQPGQSEELRKGTREKKQPPQEEKQRLSHPHPSHPPLPHSPSNGVPVVAASDLLARLLHLEPARPPVSPPRPQLPALANNPLARSIPT